jgi:hypothetical protein
MPNVILMGHSGFYSITSDRELSCKPIDPGGRDLEGKVADLWAQPGDKRSMAEQVGHGDVRDLNGSKE